MQRIVLQNITVRNCTRTGVEIEGARDVRILQCSFTDNGNAAQDGSTFNNLSLTRVSESKIWDSRASNSPSGCGIKISNCEDLALERNELARNARQAIDATNSGKLYMQGNLIEGNESGGIAVTADESGFRLIDVLDNQIQYNGGKAVHIAFGHFGTVRNNRIISNQDDQVLIEHSDQIEQ